MKTYAPPGRRTAIFTILGTITALGIGYMSIARAQDGARPGGIKNALEGSGKQLSVRPEVGRLEQLPQEVRQTATAVERRNSLPQEVRPPYNLKHCCPPVSVDLLLQLFTDAPRQEWMSPYALQWSSSPAAQQYTGSMMWYAGYIGALYGGTAEIFPVLSIYSGENKCNSPKIGWMWKILSPNRICESPYNTIVPITLGQNQNLLVNTTYYVNLIHMVCVRVPGKEPFWITLDCESPCIKFSINGGLARIRRISNLDDTKVIESDQQGRVLRDTTRREMRVDDQQGEMKMEASASSESSCKPCAE